MANRQGNSIYGIGQTDLAQRYKAQPQLSQAAPAPPAEPKPQQFFDRDPYPHIEYGTVDPGSTYSVKYTNGLQEISEIQQILVKAPPKCTVEVHREEDNQDQTVQVAQKIQDLDTDEAGNPTLFFRQVERDKTLAVRKNQKLIVIISNPYAVKIGFACKVFKNALRFYTPRDVVKEAATGR